MSRIEIAMEKAARIRDGKLPGQEGASEVHSGDEGLQVWPIQTLSPRHPFLVNLHDPLSDTAEEYRKLKQALVEMATAREGGKNSVVITSSVAKEGRTLTALNLAISLAKELDHRVLLVDADLRNPSLHRYLEIEQGIGLSDLLLDRAKLKDALLETGIGKLSVLPAGTKVSNPEELFNSTRMKTIVEQLKRAYPDRYLIFDTAPVLPFAETRSLAHLVDGVFFVVMEGTVSQSNVREALESLKGCPIVGTVYNAALLGAHEERYSLYQPYRWKPQGSRAVEGDAPTPPDQNRAE